MEDIGNRSPSRSPDYKHTPYADQFPAEDLDGVQFYPPSPPTDGEVTLDSLRMATQSLSEPTAPHIRPVALPRDYHSGFDAPPSHPLQDLMTAPPELITLDGGPEADVTPYIEECYVSDDFLVDREVVLDFWLCLTPTERKLLASCDKTACLKSLDMVDRVDRCSCAVCNGRRQVPHVDLTQAAEK